ncbi:uncharacterized protein LOC129582009 [Paramacrobiotus metropolitanus]|uniref:uncharacterized protein LOC129582009 n=1 Tax=Paramacrobiotus metropolitanus TaxID=2943436 RepID=UPI002445F835|nr:uncharacterized protein LOC129582009 [Paramacrobiotus metropolitanus]XP_055329349.1 uncharacterized protein LOC129582009 [Paramacrobiotus metropolitanus]
MLIRSALFLFSCIQIRLIVAKYNRYFYDPFNDWDKEYYDSPSDNLKIAAPPPPPVPDPPQIRADFSFEIPKIPLPSLPAVGNIGGPPFAAVQTFSTLPYPAINSIPDGGLPLGGYGAFSGNSQPYHHNNFGGYGIGLRGGPGFGFNGIGAPMGVFNNLPNVGGYNDFGGHSAFPSVGGYNGFTGYNSRDGSIGGYGYGNQFQTPFNNFQNNFQNNLMAQPASFAALPEPLPPLPAISFSNYDNNGLLPQFPPVDNFNRISPVANQGPFDPLPVTFEKDADAAAVPLKPVVENFDAAIKRERLCKPTGRPGLTGFCRNNFDVINNRVCNKMAVDSRNTDCAESELCCYWRPKTALRALPPRISRPTLAPGYAFVARRAPDQETTDYYHFASRKEGNGLSADEVPGNEDEGNVTIGNSNNPVDRGLDAASGIVNRVMSEGDAFSWEMKACGKLGVKSGNRRVSRILNGDKALDGEFCWQAAIFLGNEYLCGGALIDDIHVITSAHCIQRFQRDKTANNLRVIFGATDVKNVPVGGCAQAFGISSVKLHDAFNSKTLSNDIAVLRLSNSVPANNCSCALCLPESWTGPLRIDSTCLVTGYGLSSTTNPLSYGRLRSSQVQVINSTTGPVNCQMIMNDYSGMPIDYKLDPSMFCTLSRDQNYANGLGVGDTCMRDGGSPLICALDADDPQRFTLTGIVTWGLGCGRTTESVRMPSVYTNVRKQVQWIKRNLQ